MRGIVAEINGKYAIIMAQDGTFKKIKAMANMAVGNEIDLNQPTGNIKVSRLMTRVSAIAAAALFVIGISYGAYSYTVPYSYVDVDINPSIELTVNVYDRIIKTEALNEDGKKILGNKNLKNSSLEAGVSHILSIALEQGYLKATNKNTEESVIAAAEEDMINSINSAINESRPVIENAVLFTVSSEDGYKSGELKKELADMASKVLKNDSVNSEVLVGEASVKQRADARAFGVTPGKLVLIEDAIEGKPELKLEDLKKAAVKDLIKNAKDKKADEEKRKADEEKQNAANNTEEANNGGESNGQINDKNDLAAQITQSEKKEQATWQKRLSEELAILEKEYEKSDPKNDADEKVSSSNNSINSDSKSNKSDNKSKSNNISPNSDVNDSSYKGNHNGQDIADILKREKQKRQQLKDELLKQLKDNKQVGENSQADQNQQASDDKENRKNSKGGNGGKKK